MTRYLIIVHGVEGNIVHVPKLVLVCLCLMCTDAVILLSGLPSLLNNSVLVFEDCWVKADFLHAAHLWP